MKKRILVAAVGIFLLIVVCAVLWQYHASPNDTMEEMCGSSVHAALEHFRNYEKQKNESEYMAGVAEFRTYMTAYLCLLDGRSNTDYIWCNILYGDMILNPENVKAHMSELVAALEYLVEDYDHPNWFHLINALNNSLKAE